MTNASQTDIEIEEHLAWLKTYAETATENNWLDNAAYASRQVDRLRALIAGARSAERPHAFTGNGPGVEGADNCQVCGRWSDEHDTPADWPLEVGSEPVAWRDMLAALKAAEEWLSGWASAEPYIDTIRAAIAKAENAAPPTRSAEAGKPDTVAERREEPDKQSSQDVPSGSASGRDLATVAGSVFIRPRSPSAEADEDPHMKLHIYEGDSALVIRKHGNKTLYGVQRPELLALFEVRSAEALPDEALTLLIGQLKWRADSMNGARSASSTVADMNTIGYYSQGDQAIDRRSATTLSRLSAELAAAIRNCKDFNEAGLLVLNERDEAKKNAAFWEKLATTLNDDCDKYKGRAERAERLLASQADEIRRKDEALKPFANAYTRLEYYGGQPGNSAVLYASHQDQTFYELLDGVEGDPIRVWHLRSARAALRPEGKQQEGADICPVCAEPLKAGDVCASDIEMGACHAECLEGSPVVDLDTGDPVDGPVSTYIFEQQEVGR